MKSCLRIFAVALLLWGPHARAQWADPSRHWRTLETAHFSLHFAEETRSRARVVAEVAETVYPRITGWLNWKPESRTHLVLLDSADFANGFATPLPFDNFAIFLSPPDEGELLQNRAWLELVLTHEFTHVVHLDKASRAPLVLRRIFGRFPWLFPNVWEPGWLVEGLAVYSESDAGKRYGRLGQSQFEGMMRAENARGLLSLRELNADGRGFPLNRDYLYGSYFFAFLAERYGPQSILDYVENYSDNVLPFRIHSNPVAVTGKPMDALWLEYQDWLRARFAAVPEDPGVRPDAGGEIIARAWSLTTPVLTREGERWYVRADGYTRPKLVRQARGGSVEAVREVESGARLAASPGGGMLVAQPEICKNYNYFYDLYRRAAGGDWNRLTRCGRFRFAAPLADGRIVALRVASGEGEVVVLDKQGAVESTLYRTAPGEMLTGLAARDRTVVLTGLRDGRWSLVEIADGKTSVLLADEAVKHSPRFGDSPDEIYFVADYGKVYNVWSWRRDRRQLSRWTQALNGVREISAPVAGEMLLTTIEADGDVLRLHRIGDSPLERRDAAAPAGALAGGESSSAAADDRPPGPDRPYSPWSSLMPRSWFPMFNLAEGAVALGVQTFGQDALGLHNYTLAPMYEFTQKEALGSAAYDYDGRHGVLLDRQMTVKASTQTGSGQNGKLEITDYTIKESAQWVSTWRSVSLNARYYWGLGGALDQESFHQVGIGTLSAHDERVLALVAGVDTRRWQWLSEGPSQGQQLRLFAETSNGLHGAYSGDVYRSDWRAHLPLGKTVVSLRWNEVYAQPEAEAVQLGGTASEETYALPVLNQREFPLRGYTSGESVLTGHRARLGTIEWRIPLADVDRHFMVPPAGLNRVSMNVFVDSGSAWENGAPQHYYRGVGFELLSELRLGYLLGLQVRAGVAKGLDGPGKTIGYLRVGRSF
ncbi:MAG: hypothetical protein WA373_01450 [Burkholderiales bacterium]